MIGRLDHKRSRKKKHRAVIPSSLGINPNRWDKRGGMLLEKRYGKKLLFTSFCKASVGSTMKHSSSVREDNNFSEANSTKGWINIHCNTNIALSFCSLGFWLIHAIAIKEKTKEAYGHQRQNYFSFSRICSEKIPHRVLLGFLQKIALLQ